MASILVVDDNATNRKLLSVLLKHEGHATLEANDGEDGLARARAVRPQLVISDILMPSMDGYEFVRRLRADPELGDIPVIFYTAHYHEREARALAQSCGVARVLIKPCPVADILGAVEHSLTGIPELPATAADEHFTREHLKLLTNKLSEKAIALQASNQRLEALTELNAQLAAEHDPDRLLDRACRAARTLIGAHAAVLAVGEAGAVRCSSHGIEAAALPLPRLDAGLLGRVLSQQRALRVTAQNNELLDTGLPPATRMRVRSWPCPWPPRRVPTAGCACSTRSDRAASTPATSTCCRSWVRRWGGSTRMTACMRKCSVMRRSW